MPLHGCFASKPLVSLSGPSGDLWSEDITTRFMGSRPSAPYLDQPTDQLGS
jgi:hypothetical protein